MCVTTCQDRVEDSALKGEVFFYTCSLYINLPLASIRRGDRKRLCTDDITPTNRGKSPERHGASAVRIWQRRETYEREGQWKKHSRQEEISIIVSQYKVGLGTIEGLFLFVKSLFISNKSCRMCAAFMDESKANGAETPFDDSCCSLSLSFSLVCY